LNEFRACVNAVRKRQQRQWLWQCMSTGLLVSGLVACFVAVAFSRQWFEIHWMHLAGTLVAGPVLGWVSSANRSRSERDAAAAIDQTYQLKDRATTALEFLAQSAVPTVWQGLQLEDAVQHLALVDPQTVAPIRVPRSWFCGLGVSAVALAISFFGAPAEPAFAKAVLNEVVMAQAIAVEDSLKELQEFNTEGIDVEMEELLRELAEHLDELKQPGLNRRDAMAGLSKLETALQEKLQQLESPDTAAQLADIGAALSLADEMRAAGDAMSNGDLDRAAEELANLEMPKLDRHTNTAVTDQLRQVEQNEASGSSRKLKEAAAQTAFGLSKRNRSAFRDGVKGLVDECKKQERRKKLSGLLKKQCRSLAENKNECASESENTGNRRNRSGNKWGLGRSTRQLGEMTSKFSASNRMNITGQKSTGGDNEVETVTAPRTLQEAIRRHRNQADRPEQLTESVLDSEPVPLGHRQTIRRYFKLIRPQAGEMDAVNQQAGSVE